MRYMWMCNTALLPDAVTKMLEANGGTVITRVFRSRERALRVFITNYSDFKFAIDHALNDATAYHWSISSCNKQYVTNEVTGKYVGALSEVGLEEANAWVLSSAENWALRGEDTTWIPVMRNPNRMIPTGDYDGFCPHCGQDRNRTPGNRFRAQYRPWPLHKDA